MTAGAQHRAPGHHGRDGGLPGARSEVRSAALSGDPVERPYDGQEPWRARRSAGADLFGIGVCVLILAPVIYLVLRQVTA